jgi:hypothetical protein
MEIVDAGPPVDLCPSGQKYCTGFNTRHACLPTPNGLRWTDETCAGGSGCVSGDCVAGACSDACTLGDSANGKTCQLVDLGTGSVSSTQPQSSLHDRAREYERWLKRDGLASGSVGDARYSDPPTYSQIVTVNDSGDSALWTGTYLAAEAARLQATGAADARANVRRIAGIIHDLLHVSGSPGNLARWATKTGTGFTFDIPDYKCSDTRVHCGVQYDGQSWDYIGHVSRDQYQGVMLGAALAYDALGPQDDDVRDVLRADVVTLVKELMTERLVNVSILLNGTRLPASMVHARFIVVNPAEMVNGALDLEVNTSGGSDEMYGFQEFSPDLSDLIHELPLLSWVPPLPRPSSAIMLASFFNVALHMTTDRPQDQADHDSIFSYYTTHSGTGGNISDWLTIAKMWTPDTGCSQAYYGNNITMQPLYNLARLEQDPLRGPDIRDTLFAQKLWPTYAPTKNPFFSFIFAGTASSPQPQVVSSAAAQLLQFPPPPRVMHPVDLTSDPRYPHDATCTNQVDHSMAVDVGDRRVTGFMWEVSPWDLYDPGDVNQTEPGVDYLVAYWLGRKHGFFTDDAPGRCTAMR